MSAILAAPFIASTAVGLAALLWCRGMIPLLATMYGVGLVWALVA